MQLKRIAAVFLALLLIVTSIPLGTFAEEPTEPAATEATTVTEPDVTKATTEATEVTEATEETTAPSEEAPTEAPTEATGETTEATEAATEPEETEPQTVTLDTSAGNAALSLTAKTNPDSTPVFHAEKASLSDEEANNLVQSFGLASILDYYAADLTVSDIVGSGTLEVYFEEALTALAANGVHFFTVREGTTKEVFGSANILANGLYSCSIDLEDCNGSYRIIVVSTSENAVSTVDTGGSSGSGTTGGGGTGNSGSGGFTTGTQLVYSAPGVTMQVVYHKYGTHYDRDSTYNNIITEVKNCTGVFDGFTVAQTFIGDPTTGRVFPMSFENKLGTLDYTYAPSLSTVLIDPRSHATVSGSASNGTMPTPNAIKKYLQQIIFGSEYGAWDKEDVLTSSSLYASVLRYLGVEQQYIDNYLASRNEKWSPRDPAHADALIPSIIWSYVTVECNDPHGRTWNGAFYTINDSTSKANNLTCTTLGTGRLRVYTVGDIADASASKNGKAANTWQSWWLKSYSPGEGGSSATASGYTAICGTCGWPYGTTWACSNVLGTAHGTGGAVPHNGGARNYPLTGTGYVSFIQADGVDNWTGSRYYFRGYWTPYGSLVLPDDQPVTLKKSIDASAACIAQIQGNAMYSLAGAEYSISMGGKYVETLVTDAKGEAV